MMVAMKNKTEDNEKNQNTCKVKELECKLQKKEVKEANGLRQKYDKRQKNDADRAIRINKANDRSVNKKEHG